MKMRSNKISDIKLYIKEELKNVYDNRELDSIINYLFEHFLQLNRNELVMHADDSVTESLLLEIHFAVKKLKKNIPIQYVLGCADFCDIKLRVIHNALIPRPETEETVYWNVNDQKGKNEILTILDVGTGSGCIALALKKHLDQKAVVFGMDQKAEIIDLARENALKHKLHVEFIVLDLLDNTKWSKLHHIDIIVSNPPYVTYQEKENLHARIMNYEPHDALFVSDENPLLFYEKITELAGEKLKEGGMLYFEINEKYGKDIEMLLKNKGFKNVDIRKDIHDKDRMIKCSKES